MASPPKPWERAGANAASTSAASAPAPSMNNPSTATATTATTSTLPSGAPALPAMPATLTSAVSQTAAAYPRPLGASPYGGYGSAYSSPYGGGMYSRYGGYGGYGGGMYGAYGGYGGGMYGGGMYGMPGAAGDPNDPNSLTNRFNTSTQATFQMLEGIVGAFGGFAQMLESTYMATHSSFFAMVSVAEQFGNLRDALGSVLGIFTLMRWIRTLIAKLTGRPPPADATSLTPAAFARFEGRAKNAANLGPDGQTRPSRKPLFFFILAAFGLPYLMNKAIRSFATSQQEEERRRLELQNQPTDPAKLDFCRVLYDFSPSALGQPGGGHTAGIDLEVKKGDFVAVLSRSDPNGNPSEWWRCRSRDGRVGYLPSNYLEVMQRRTDPATAPPTVSRAAIKDGAAAASDSSSRTSSLTSSVSAPVTAPASQQPPPMPSSKIGDISPESFQKSHFYG